MNFDDSKVSYHIHVSEDDIPVRGNAMASGDDAFDKQVEDEIIARLNDGDVWAWANVNVVATYEGLVGFEGNDYLGCCNYADEEDFKQPGGYYDDMKDIARDDLYGRIEGFVRRAQALEAKFK